MALGDFLSEVFIGVIWEGLLNFVGACLRFSFVRKPFNELLKEYDVNPFIALIFVFIVILLIVLIE